MQTAHRNSTEGSCITEIESFDIHHLFLFLSHSLLRSTSLFKTDCCMTFAVCLWCLSCRKIPSLLTSKTLWFILSASISHGHQLHSQLTMTATNCSPNNLQSGYFWTLNCLVSCIFGSWTVTIHLIRLLRLCRMMHRRCCWRLDQVHPKPHFNILSVGILLFADIKADIMPCHSQHLSSHINLNIFFRANLHKWHTVQVWDSHFGSDHWFYGSFYTWSSRLQIFCFSLLFLYLVGIISHVEPGCRDKIWCLQVLITIFFQLD